jgi:hypothetical protein
MGSNERSLDSPPGRRTLVDHLDKGHLGLGKAGLGEDRLDTDGSSNGIIMTKGARHHTNNLIGQTGG